MVVGCLGDIIFQVSEETTETLQNTEWSGEARYAVHQRHLQNALTEFTGIEPDTISFSMQLTPMLGVDIVRELKKFFVYERSGEALPLVIGDKPYGKYRWNIVKHSAKYEESDVRGNPLLAVVDVELQEYIRS